MEKPVMAQKTGIESRFFRAMDKKVALSDAEKLKIAALKKTAKLRELRLAKEAEARAAEATNSKPKKRRAKRKKLPVFERDA